MALKDIAEALVAHCRNGTEREALATLYADDAVSSEAMSFDGRSPDTAGRDGISGKHDWWDTNFETTVQRLLVRSCTRARRLR